MELEEEWSNFMKNNMNNNDSECTLLTSRKSKSNEKTSIPKCGNLKISTKSKIIYLNQEIDISELFWCLPITNYDDETNGIIKKQIKLSFTNSEDVKEFEKKTFGIKNINIKILNQIDNPSGRVKFKDVRKIDIGFSKKDVIYPKKFSKSAFYNCCVIVFKKYYENKFQEFHIKLFNSGKIEIPGIQTEEMLETSIDYLIQFLQPFYNKKIYEVRQKRELVLVNSNFNCNYYLNREDLLNILKKKYKIKCSLDSCSYPGLQCKYMINDKEISFMVFRTGSVLIVGKCSDEELETIYNFLKNMFHDEYYNICEEKSKLETIEKEKSKNKKKNKKKITIYI